MKAKTGKELQKELDYQRIQEQREEYAGENCLTVVDGNQVIAIGENQECKSCRDFIIQQLVDDPKKIMNKGCFTDLDEMYSYFFENSDDESELSSFLKDYYDGIEMENYGRA